MEFKKISNLSFFSDEQKEWFRNYIVYENGDIFNEKTGKSVAKTLHGSRGYVVNLSIYVEGIRKQRQIIVHRAMADLFIGPIKDGEKIYFYDENKENINISNIAYTDTEKSRKAKTTLESIKAKGITKDGRICTSCNKFKIWKEMAGKKSSICRLCASQRGMKYQKTVNYSNQSVKFKTYSERLKQDNPVDVNGLLGAICSKCKNVFLLTRSKVLSRIRSIRLSYNVKPLICKECIEKGENDE